MDTSNDAQNKLFIIEDFHMRSPGPVKLDDMGPHVEDNSNTGEETCDYWRVS